MKDMKNEQWIMDKYRRICESRLSGYALVSLTMKRFRIFNRLYDRSLGDLLIEDEPVIRDMSFEPFQGKVFSGMGVFPLPQTPVGFYTAQYNADNLRYFDLEQSLKNAFYSEMKKQKVDSINRGTVPVICSP